MKYPLCFLGWLTGIVLIRVFPHRSLLAAIGVLLFAGFSLVLLALFARFVGRWLKSRRRGVRWGLIGGAVLLVLALFVLQRLNTPGDKVEMSRANSVDTSEVAIDGTHATAVVAFRGGSFDGSRLAVRLIKDGGDWKMDRFVAFRHFDRGKFDRAYRRKFLEFGSPTSSANCALGKARRFSNAEIERATLNDAQRVFTPIFIACDRDGAERAIIRSIAEPKFDLPPRAIQCAAGKVEALSDAELVRVQLSTVVYGKLIYSCGHRAMFAYLERELKARENLDREEVDCVLSAFRSRPTAGAIRLSYDQARYNELIDGCRQ